jgi:D-alanine-D-alanine ligase
VRLALVHNALSVPSSPDDRDVLVQVQAVHQALEKSGHTVCKLTCGLNLEEIRSRLMFWQTDVVFNLVESLAGTGRLITHFPALLDAMPLPYTGAGTEALFLTSNKLLAKAWMHAAGLPTPVWIDPFAFESGTGEMRRPETKNRDGRWIIKSVWEHASIGLDETSLVNGFDLQTLLAAIHQRAPLLGGSSFGEAYIEGREFNLSLLDGFKGPQVLPPAEILFEGYEDGKTRIVDYRAKWDEHSFEFHHTPRRFEFGHQDLTLLDQLTALARTCWHLFRLKGYARVDFRVDTDGRPWILEVNANPCLSPDAGYAAALQQAGISFDEAVNRILAAAEHPSSGTKGASRGRRSD